eukprot:TRINITY_DN8487_c1_g2_i1.p1 TRINITY_DN8487_c1_g2~~TRINITY_DN8487_c1_g2_i1.p1  ORF type:complete len:610 (-),score=116.47 TRINITY_DN8487_c1_g2_i1:220-1962(-)
MAADNADNTDGEVPNGNSFDDNLPRLSVQLPQASAPLFPDVNDLKAKVRSTILKPQYNVHDYYERSRWATTIATHPLFEHITLCVISVNALWIAIDADNNEEEVLINARPIFQVAEHLFCLFFFFEWCVRFCAFEVKRNGLRDSWFVFDSVLVFMMVVETWIFSLIILMTGGSDDGASPMGDASILRLLRLLRLSRLARMLRSMPELMILIKGMLAAARSVFFTMCLLLIVIYIFAIALVQMSAGTEAEKLYFSSIPETMYLLLIHGTFLENLGTMVENISKSGFIFPVVLYAFISIAALMVMNMLIGVLCEVVSAVASTENEEMTVTFVKGKMEMLIAKIDKDDNNFISKTEFCKILEQSEAVVALHEVGVDPVGLVDFADFIFCGQDGEEIELSFEDFMEVVLELRGSNMAKIRDVMNLQRVIRQEVSRVEEKVFTNQMNKSKLSRTDTLNSESMRQQDSQHSGGLREVANAGTGTTSRGGSPAASCGNTQTSPFAPRLGKRDKLEGFLSAAQDELRKFRPSSALAAGGVPCDCDDTSTGAGSARTSTEFSQMQAWAVRMEEIVSNGLLDLHGKTRLS